MAIVIEHGRIRPNSKGIDTICESCLQPCAKWDVNILGSVCGWCAKCLLYKSDWGRGLGAQLEDLISAVEAHMKQSLRDADGLLNHGGADRIMMSIVITSAYVQGKKCQS